MENNTFLNGLKVILLSFLLFSMQLNAQTISTVSPNKGYQGQTLDVFITGQSVDFLTGSSSIQTSFNQGPNSIPGPKVSVNSAGTVLGVQLDLNTATYPMGFYDLSVNTPANGLLTLNNAFEIDPNPAISLVSPNKAHAGQFVDLFITAPNFNFSPGSSAIIVRLRNGSRNITGTLLSVNPSGTTLEVRFDLRSNSNFSGFYDLTIITPTNGTLRLSNAFEIDSTPIISSVTPNKGQIGQILDVFITGQNVNFLSGSSAIQTNFIQGTTSIAAPPLSVDAFGKTLKVQLDLSNTSFPSGFYNLSVNSPSNGILTLNNAFEIDTAALLSASPQNFYTGQTQTVLVVGRYIDFSTVTIPPIYEGIGGTNTINTTIVGTRGNDTLELTVNLSTGTIASGNYNLSVIIPGDTLLLRNALEVKTTNISGTVYYDLNSNGTQDLNELGLRGVKLTELPSGKQTYTDASGNYSFQNLGIQTYQVVVVPPDSTFLTTPPDTQTVVINMPNKYVASYGINTNSTSALTNVDISLYSGRARCFESVLYTVAIRNDGFASRNGVYTVIKDSRITFDSLAIAGADSISGDTIFYSFTNLLPGQGFTKRFSCNVPSITILPVGATIAASGEVIPKDNSGVTIPNATNTDSDATIVRCSFDPNDKLVEPAGIDTAAGYVLHDTRLEYTIRFQNTGNDTAYKVMVLDTLSNNLDLNTFEFVTATHAVVTELKMNGELSFTFNNIFLVDSTTNEPASNGLVKFKISPKPNLVDSTIITNLAGIFFDFNPPVITNEVINTFVTTLPVSIREHHLDLAAEMFPNPSNGWLKIQTEERLNDAQLTVYTIDGRVVYEINQLSGKQLEFDLTKLSKGVYFIRLIDGDKQTSSKMVFQ